MSSAKNPVTSLEEVEEVVSVVDEQEDVKEEKTPDKKKEVTGIKEIVSNPTAAEEAEQLAKDGKEDKFDYPSLFVTENDLLKVNIQILFDGSTGKPVLMSVIKNPDLKLSELKFLKRVIEWAEFTMPSYDDMVAYRESAMVFDKDTNQFLADPVKMRLCYIRYHLKNWSIKKNGEILELVREGRGLTNETIMEIGSINPSLMDMFLTEFERESMLLA